MDSLKDRRRGAERFRSELLELSARLMVAEELLDRAPHKVRDEIAACLGVAYCAASIAGIPDDAIMAEADRLSRFTSWMPTNGP